jgi:hemerythrin-like domain-containing protein
VLRDKNLIPLSHQHQHALALCVRIERAIQAGEIDTQAFQSEIVQIFQQEILSHFEAEEELVFTTAEKFAELKILVSELVAEHAVLREMFEVAGQGELDSGLLKKFTGLLSSHVRKEERQLFERMQGLMSSPEMSDMGIALQEKLASAERACLLPNEATRLKPKIRSSGE